MKPELEAILRVLDALQEEADPERARALRENYDCTIAAALEKNPRVPEETLRRMIRIYYPRWGPRTAQDLLPAAQGLALPTHLGPHLVAFKKANRSANSW